MIDRIARAAAILLSALLAACSSDSGSASGNYKIGDPYTIAGQTYYPHEDPEYDETGIASWYGPGFAGRKTANGEIFDPDEITAAHKTLPMPVNVRITNLENGRSIVARVNDRGPFKPGRIIDVSQQGAELLGFRRKGMARVRVQFLEVALLPEGSRGKRVAGKGEEADVGTRPVRVAAAPPVVVAPTEPGSPPVPVASPLDQPTGEVIKMPVSRSRIYVQAGSFLDRANAEALVARLRPIGEFKITSVTSGDKIWYRVRFGPVRNPAQAEGILDRVLMDGQTGAQIIVE